MNDICPMTSPNRDRVPPALIEASAGLSAGLVSTIIVHPLDIIKTRLQVDTSSHPLLNSSRTVLRDIWRNEGPNRIAALYRGLSPNLVGNSAGWALYFLWYRKAQDAIRRLRGYGPEKPLSSLEYLSASAISGGLSAIVTNPIWVVKTRMLSTSAREAGAYPGLTAGLRSIYRQEGYRGFFHGLTPSLFGVSHGALYFVAYEKVKLWRRQSTGHQSLSALDVIGASSLSKVLAGTVTYPHQVVRARLQAHHPTGGGEVSSAGVLALIRQIWRNEGLLGYYKGLFPNLLRVVPSTCVTFLVYENSRWLLPRIFNDRSEDAASDKALSTSVDKKGAI